MQSIRPFLTLIRQEMFRFLRLSRQTIFPPIITTCLYILIFGFSLGNRIQEIHGFPYILYLVPGLAAMGVMNSSFANNSTSLYMAKFDKSLENLLAAPLTPVQIVLALVIGGLARSLVIGTIILTISLLLLKQMIFNPWITLFFFAAESVIFGCWGIIGALRAVTWDNLATTENFILTPLIYLGGVFYSMDLLPKPWRTISLANPLFYLVDGTRYGVLGVCTIPMWQSALWAAGLALSLFIGCVYLFRTGYRLVK